MPLILLVIFPCFQLHCPSQILVDLLQCHSHSALSVVNWMKLQPISKIIPMTNALLHYIPRQVWNHCYSSQYWMATDS